jgi:hypothetical protein
MKGQPHPARPFFIIGVKNESLKLTGKQPTTKDRLNRYVMNGVNKLATSLKTETGSGLASPHSYIIYDTRSECTCM